MAKKKTKSKSKAKGLYPKYFEGGFVTPQMYQQPDLRQEQVGGQAAGAVGAGLLTAMGVPAPLAGMAGAAAGTFVTDKVLGGERKTKEAEQKYQRGVRGAEYQNQNYSYNDPNQYAMAQNGMNVQGQGNVPIEAEKGEVIVDPNNEHIATGDTPHEQGGDKMHVEPGSAVIPTQDDPKLRAKLERLAKKKARIEAQLKDAKGDSIRKKSLERSAANIDAEFAKHKANLPQGGQNAQYKDGGIVPDKKNPYDLSGIDTTPGTPEFDSYGEYLNPNMTGFNPDTSGPANTGPYDSYGTPYAIGNTQTNPDLTTTSNYKSTQLAPNGQNINQGRELMSMDDATRGARKDPLNPAYQVAGKVRGAYDDYQAGSEDRQQYRGDRRDIRQEGRQERRDLRDLKGGSDLSKLVSGGRDGDTRDRANTFAQGLMSHAPLIYNTAAALSKVEKEKPQYYQPRLMDSSVDTAPQEQMINAAHRGRMQSGASGATNFQQMQGMQGQSYAQSAQQQAQVHSQAVGRSQGIRNQNVGLINQGQQINRQENIRAAEVTAQNYGASQRFGAEAAGNLKEDYNDSRVAEQQATHTRNREQMDIYRMNALNSSFADFEYDDNGYLKFKYTSAPKTTTTTTGGNAVGNTSNN
jgi:hypothetical protein